MGQALKTYIISFKYEKVFIEFTKAELCARNTKKVRRHTF